MRFLFFPSGSYVSGLESVTLGLMRELRAQGHPCYAIVSGWNDGHYPAMLTQAGVPHRSIKLGRFYLKKPSWTLDGLANFPRACRELREVIAEFRPDVMVLTGVEFALTVMHTAPRGVPYVLHLHDVPSARWGNALGRHVLARTSGVIAVSEFVRSRLAAMAGPNLAIRAVHNGLPVPEPAARSTSTKLRVGIVGQLMPRKRHAVLVDAIGQLDRKVRDKIEVCIYGADTSSFAGEINRKIAEAGLADVFRWMGFVASQAEIYGNLDLVIAPAVEEPFGTTVLEAGLHGLPVVAARSGGFPEMIVDGLTGILVSPDDPQELAKALEELFDQSARTCLGDNARRHISSQFTTALMARKFVKAMEAFGVRPAG